MYLQIICLLHRAYAIDIDTQWYTSVAILAKAMSVDKEQNRVIYIAW